MRDAVSLDYETYSDVHLTKVGSSRYTAHPSTEVLMGSYKMNDSAVVQWDAAGGEDMPRELSQALVDPDVEKWAWNANFEIQVTNKVLRIESPIEQWRCTMVLAMACSLPGKLEKAGPILDLDMGEQKLVTGRRLIKKFSVPSKSRKEATRGQMIRTQWYEDLPSWREYLDYNFRDTVSESAIKRRLMQFKPMPEEEWELWHLDQTINARGLPINLEMVQNASRIYHRALLRQQRELNKLTGLENASSTQQLLPWLLRQGYMFNDCQKGHIKTARAYFDTKPTHWEDEQWETYRSNKDLKKALDIRLETSRTSIKKYDTLLTATDLDGNLRNTLQFCGAQRTWRWAGRIFQPHNLPRPDKYLEKGIEIHAANLTKLDIDSMELIYKNVFDVLASCIRPSAQAPEGYLLVDADLNAIENRVLGWLAQCIKILRVFALKRDPYIDFATYLFHSDYDTLWHEYKGLGLGAKRSIAKPGVLGCGYMLGAGERRVNRQTGEIEGTGLLGYAWDMGVTQFTEQDSALSVETFRREFHEVKTYWYGIEKAARRCILTGKPQEYGHGFGIIRFDRLGPFMRMILPSGRALHYVRPKVEEIRAPWGEMKQTITYESLNDRKQWVRTPTHPGKLTENADQAIARDLLAHGMLLAHKRGIDVRLHVHDQIVALALKDRADEALRMLIECMEIPPSWAPDMPLGSNGFTSPVFMKD